MVPWAPAKVHAHAASSSIAAAAEMMDAIQDGDDTSMEVEHGVESQTTPPAVCALQGEAFHHHHHHHHHHQWPAQHYVASPQLQLLSAPTRRGLPPCYPCRLAAPTRRRPPLLWRRLPQPCLLPGQGGVGWIRGSVLRSRKLREGLDPFTFLLS